MSMNNQCQQCGLYDGQTCSRANCVRHFPFSSPPTPTRTEFEAAAQWEALYRRAINEANGLTNYVEDRPELTCAERKITAIENEARALRAAAMGWPTVPPAPTPKEPTP